MVEINNADALKPFTEFNWINSDCVGPPSSIFKYPDDTFSNTLQVTQIDYLFEQCRKKRMVHGEHCCHSNIVPGFLGVTTKGFAGTYDVRNAAKIPSAANNNIYCRLQVSAPVSNNPFSEVFFLADGQCVQGFVCTKNKISIYPTSNCSSGVSLEDYQLFENDTVQFESVRLGTVKAEMKMIRNGSLDYQWVTYFPQTQYYPLNYDAFEIFGTVCQGIALTLSLAALFHFVRLVLYNRSSRRKVYAVFAFYHLVWLAYLIMDIIFEYFTTDDIPTFNRMVAADLGLHNAATLITVLANAYVTMTIAFTIPTLYKVLVYIGLLLIHFALVGPEYFPYLRVDEGPLAVALANWTDATAVYWNVFMFIFDAICALVCAVYIIRACTSKYRNDPIWVSVVRAFRQPKIIQAFVAQLFIMALFYNNYMIVYYTTWLKSDRSDSSLQYGVDNLLYVLHSIISSRSFDHFSHLLVKMKSEEKANYFFGMAQEWNDSSKNNSKGSTVAFGEKKTVLDSLSSHPTLPNSFPAQLTPIVQRSKDSKTLNDQDKPMSSDFLLESQLEWSFPTTAKSTTFNSLTSHQRDLEMNDVLEERDRVGSLSPAAGGGPVFPNVRVSKNPSSASRNSSLPGGLLMRLSLGTNATN